MLLKDKVAVITGGARGLGLAITQAYVREGARLVIAGRSQPAVEAVCERLSAQGAAVSGLPCDVGDPAQVRRLAEHAISAFGRFDIWVNNAGVSAPYGPVTAIAPDAITTTVQTNILGTYYGSMAALEHFRPRRSGKLINLLGRGDKAKPVPLQTAYAASKAWIRSFTLSLAEENRDSGVGIYAFNPGMVSTDMLTDLEAIAGYEERLKVMPTIIRMWANPPEIPAERAVWLASPATDGRTGLEVRVTGPAQLLGGALAEGFRRIFSRQGPEVAVRVRTVPRHEPEL